jgi:hypothetical protein
MLEEDLEPESVVSEESDPHEAKDYEREITESINTIEDDKWRVFLGLIYEIRLALLNIQDSLEEITHQIGA